MTTTNNEIYKGDDIGAFGGKITVNLSNPQEYEITRVEFQCGSFYRDVTTPQFPLEFTPTREETAKFKPVNICHIRVYDQDGLRITAKGTMTIKATEEVVKGEKNGFCC